LTAERLTDKATRESIWLKIFTMKFNKTKNTHPTGIEGKESMVRETNLGADISNISLMKSNLTL
jgi:hypothetical protein